VKAARRPPRPRKSLSPSGEKLHARLALVEEAHGLRSRKTFVYFLPPPGAPRKALPEGEGPERGDLCIVFPPLFDTAEEAQLTVEAFREQACLAPVALPWKRTLAVADPPQRGRDPDRELEAVAEEREASDIRPLTEDEMRDAARGLLQTGNLFRRHVVRGALAGGQVPLGDDEEFPRAEFASSTTGTLLIRVWTYRGDQPKPRPATDADREQWASTFLRFIEACLGRSATSEHPDDEDAR